MLFISHLFYLLYVYQLWNKEQLHVKWQTNAIINSWGQVILLRVISKLIIFIVFACVAASLFSPVHSYFSSVQIVQIKLLLYFLFLSDEAEEIWTEKAENTSWDIQERKVENRRKYKTTKLGNVHFTCIEHSLWVG